MQNMNCMFFFVSTGFPYIPNWFYVCQDRCETAIIFGADQRKHHNSPSLAFVTGEFPAQMASNAENAYIW